MGVYASYVFPYRRGFLKTLFDEVCRAQHYHAVPGAGNVSALARAEDFSRGREEPPCVRLDIRRGSESWRDSAVRLYFTRGIIEFDDIIRYHNNDSSHQRACKYYESFLGDTGSVVPDFCNSWDYPVNDGHELDENELLLELPRELMTADEKAAFEAVHGSSEPPGQQSVHGSSEQQSVHGSSEQKSEHLVAETAIRTGDVEALRAHLDGNPPPETELSRLAALCCRARSPLCLDLVLGQSKEPWPEISARLSKAVEDGDTVTVSVLLERGAPSYNEDIYRAAQLGHRDAFDVMLDKMLSRV